MQVNFTKLKWRLKYTKLLMTVAFFISMTATASAQILYNEGFEAAAYPPLPTGWAEQNLSTPPGLLPNWFAGVATNFPSHSGTGYISANFNAVSGNNTISEWLFAPTVTLKNGDILVFWTRTTTGTFPDRLQVRMSTNGTSVNVGATNTSVGDFTTILQDINPGLTTTGYPIVWTQYTTTLSGLPVGGISGRIAFRYFVTGGGPSGANSDLIGIDDVSYTTFPGACSGAPALGNAQSSVASACPNVAFNLSVSTPPATSGITYQWQSSATGVAGSYTNIAGATSATYTVPNQTATTYYQLVATCGASVGTSAPVMVPESVTCYCLPGATSCSSGDQITNVTVGGINNNSTCSAGPPTGYGNYLALTPGSLFRGAANPATVTVTNGGTEYVGIWVDYNQNGVWEASEYQFIGSGPGGTFTQNLNVPAGALLGSTRMRVRLKYNTNLVAGTDQCTAYTFGETEDYTVNIIDCIPVTVTAQPAAATAACGGTATFTAAFAGSLPGSYQWEVQTTTGGIWTNVTNVAPYSGATTTTLTINPVATVMNGYNYRLQYSGACTGISFTNPATLTVTPIAATFTQTPAALCATGTTSQTIAVTGGGTGVFTPNGIGSGLYTDAAHTIPYTGTAVTTVYAFPAATATYTLVRTNGACVSTPATVTVTVNTPVAGTPVLPAVTAICANAAGNITFTGITAGTGLTYQWQVNSIAAPATFTNVANAAPYSGATTNTLTITNPTAAMSGLQYHVIVNSVSCASTVTSNNTTLTVNPVPVVVISANNTVISPTSPVTLTAAVSSATSPITYQWYLNGVAVAGATGATYTPDANAIGDYSVTVRDANGCGSATSTPISITVTRGVTDIAFIYPSPNSGTFQVRYYNASATATQNQAAMVNVYDQKGSRIYTQRYVVTGPYTQMNVNLGTHSRGIYRVEVSDASGNRMKTGTVMVF